MYRYIVIVDRDYIQNNETTHLIVSSLLRMAPSRCVGSPNKFCYICGELRTIKQLQNISSSVKETYFKCFGFAIRQDVPWAPSKICSTCHRSLSRWVKDNSVPFRYKPPMTWMEPQSHDDCYFCSLQVEGVNRKSAAKLKYPVVRSVKRPVDFSSGVALDQNKLYD